MRFILIIYVLFIIGCGGGNSSELTVTVHKQGSFDADSFDHLEIAKEMVACTGLDIRIPIDVYTYDHPDTLNNRGTRSIVYADASGKPYHAEIILIGYHAKEPHVFRHEMGHIAAFYAGIIAPVGINQSAYQHNSWVFKQCVNA